jgi:hypothetical protein
LAKESFTTSIVGVDKVKAMNAIASLPDYLLLYLFSFCFKKRGCVEPKKSISIVNKAQSFGELT